MAEKDRGEAGRERVLIVEDDAASRVGLRELVASWGYSVEAARDGVEALEKVTEFRPGIILSDLVMPRMDGLELLRSMQQEGGDITMVILTAAGTVDTAVDAIKHGAYDFLTKPIDLQRLRILLDQIVERHETLREVKVLRRQLREQGTFGPMIGHSAQMRRVYHIIEQAAPTTASVLISGESGTGKELVAQTIHQLSPRASAPYVPINCAAIPEALLESELFGHEKGSFTGAIERRQGCFELAHLGTLFLDEIAEMAPAMQGKLLRVLQERTFRRVGGRTEQPVDIRVLAATNSVPSEAVQRGTLREDLYYRLNVIAIPLPPLRDRKEDLPILVQAFLNEFNSRHGRAITAVDPRAMQALEGYAWPGNVRQLRNVIERATIVARGPFLQIGDLPPLVDAGKGTHAEAAASPDQPPEHGAGLAPGTTVEEAERRLILMTLEHTKNNKTRAAEMLGISLKTLHNKLNRFRIEEKSEGV